MLSPNPIVCSTVGTFGWKAQNVFPTRLVVVVLAGGECDGSTHERGDFPDIRKQDILGPAFVL